MVDGQHAWTTTGGERGTKTGGRQVDSIRKVSDPFEDVEGGKRNSTRCWLCARGGAEVGSEQQRRQQP